MQAALRTGPRPLPAVAQGPPPRPALSARRSSREAVPRKVGDTPVRSWPLQFERLSPVCASMLGNTLASSQPSTCCRRFGGQTEIRRTGPGQGFPRKSGAVRAHHEHARQGQGNLGSLAHFPDSPTRATSQSGRARGGRCARRGGARRLSLLSHRYYALKAKWLGKKRLNTGTATRHCRRTRPARSAGRRPPYGPQAYGAFSPAMAQIAERFFAKGWIDAPVRRARRRAHFRIRPRPSAHPYILMNYQGKPRDVMTLAHELGHGVHQVLARNGALIAPTPLTLAETASVFGEMLTFTALLAPTRARKSARLARRQGRGHAQHRGAANRVLYVRAKHPHRARER